MGLYDAVRKEQLRRRFHPLWAAALVFAMALVTVLGLVISKPQRDASERVMCWYFKVSTGSSRTAKSRLPWSSSSVTSVASLL